MILIVSLTGIIPLDRVNDINNMVSSNDIVIIIRDYNYRGLSLVVCRRFCRFCFP